MSLVVTVSAAEPVREPQFVAFLQTADGGALFCLRWHREDGEVVSTWAKVGGRVGRYVVRSFDAAGSVLTLTDPSGHDVVVALPEGHLSAATDEEFRRFVRFIGYKGADAPMLSRQQARALWLWLIRQVGAPAAGDYELDLDGHTLPAGQRTEYLQHVSDAAKTGRTLLLIRRDGEQHFYSVPRNGFNLPEPMLRNLTAEDWDELSLLTAISRANAGELRKSAKSGTGVSPVRKSVPQDAR